MPLSTGHLLNNRYRIAKLIGQGGFGAVYRAWDTSLNQPCAVKENLDTSAEAKRQFYREATLLAGLRHPNLPRVTDHFLIPGQGQYLVMDFIEGQSLADLVSQRGQPLTETEVLPWLNQVCDALAYLHSQNPPVIHRDIKPQNIIVTPKGQAMLVDFGISKVYDPVLRTTTGGRAVTPGFSPPEQYGGSTDRTDARSDVYAFGATLFVLLTGKTPPDAIDRLTHGVALPSLSILRPDLSPGMRRLVEGALVLSHTQRPASVADLQRLISGPVGAPLIYPAGPTQQLATPRSLWTDWRLRAGLTGIALLMVSMLAFLLSRAGGGSTATPTAVARAAATSTAVSTLLARPSVIAAATETVAAPTRTSSPTTTPSPTDTSSPTPSVTPSSTPRPTNTPTTAAQTASTQDDSQAGGPFVNADAATLFRIAPTPEIRVVLQTPASGWRIFERAGGSIDKTEIWETGTVYVVRGNLSVGDTGSLNISPGVIVKVAQGAGIYVQGILRITGSEDNGVIVTALSDDAYGGDTDNNGDMVTPKSGDWSGINFYDTSRDDKTVLDYVLLRYGANPVTLNNAAPILTHIVMEQNRVNGYTLSSGTWTTNRWQNTGIPYVLTGNVTVDERSVLTIAPGVVVKAAGSGMYISGALDAQGTESQPIIFTALSDDDYGGDTDNSGDTLTPKSGDWGGISFNDTSRDDKTVLDYVLLRYAGHPITLNNAAPTLTHIAMAQNLINGYVLSSGTWTTNRWQNTGVPYVLTGNVIVDERSVLTIAPGVVVKAAGGGLFVSGVLDAQGTESQPIIFTALPDDSFGGDTDNSEDKATPKQGDWSGITFYNTPNSAKSVLTHVRLRYGSKTGYSMAQGAQPGRFQDVSVEP